MRYLSVIAFSMIFMLTVICAEKSYAAIETSQSRGQCNAKSKSSRHVVPVVCIKNRIYQIRYDRKSKAILLKNGDVRTVLQKIPLGHEPELVGTDVLIGFLVNTLQAYKEDNILLYVSAMRTNGGGGGGQCGAGSEIYLNFLDVKPIKPRIKSKILIGSCAESIELADQDISSGTIGNISLIGKNISFRFLNYRNVDGSPNATVAPDFSRLLLEN